MLAIGLGELLKLGIEVAQSTVSSGSLKDLPSEPYRGDCGNRSLCCSDDCVSAVRISCSRPQTATTIVVCGDRQSNGRVAGAPDHRSVSVGQRNTFGEFLQNTLEIRTHVSLGKDAPCTRAIERFGDIVAHPILGGLHHRYARI
jgi:hypothetical protein